MSIGRTQNTIFGACSRPFARHLVTPDRVIVPQRKPFDAPPGVVPFHRMLRSENLASSASKPDPSPSQFRVHRSCDTYQPSASVALLPKLGEVLPVAPIACAPVQVARVHQVQVPATGRVLDLYL